MSKVDRFYKAQRSLLETQVSLRELALACSTVGHADLARKLFGLARDVEAGAEVFQEIFNEQMDELLAAVKQGTANMLGAVKAGIELGKRERKP